MSSTTSDDERAAFEAWCDAGNQFSTLLLPNGRYQQITTQIAWLGWQAATKHSRAAQDDAYVCGRNDERAAAPQPSSR